jgi:ankyrin repeat protein
MKEIRLRSTTADEFVAAAGYESVEKIKAILSRRPELLNARDAGGMTALFAACGNEDQTAMVEFLLSKGADPNAKDNDGASRLEDLINRDNTRFLELLLKAGANPNVNDDQDRLIIWTAIERRRFDILRLLIEHGADVNAKDEDGETMLHHTARDGDVETTRLLIERGADLEVHRNGVTPLASAVRRRETDAVRVLVEAGADVNSKRVSDGYSVLHWACFRGNREIFQILIDAKAEVNVTDSKGMTSLDIAIDKGHDDIAELLRGYGAKTGEQLKQSARPQ